MSTLFQILDWNAHHEEVYEGDDDNEIVNKMYKIRLFGRTKDNKTIFVKVNNFYPYFYIKLHSSFRSNKLKQLTDDIKKRVYNKFQDGLMKSEIVNKHDFYGFSNHSKFQFAKLTFFDHDSFRAYERAINRFRFGGVKYRLYESNIEPFLRCMHIQDLEAVGWVKIDKINELAQVSNNEINIEVDYGNLQHVDDITIMPWVIAAFDIECVSKDGSFPQPERNEDYIIQIATTFSRFGETECFYKHITTFGQCYPIEGVDLECYDTEQEMLLSWTNMIRKTNPDIITGYNIVGFDMEYMMKRAKLLGIEDRFSQLSRIVGEQCKWQEKKLASSALGENLMKYYDMTGRVIIDLMKVVQRDFKLSSYKLDYVASSFIKEGITKLELDKTNNKSIITTKSTYGVKLDQYITIFYNDSITDNKHMDGKKFQICGLEKTQLTVNGIIDDEIMSMGYKVSWCQAKDDITPQQIFKYQRTHPIGVKSRDRTLIAKYCIQDSELCNKLMSKLQVLTNNIGMANVCHVPLSYLFMRGQGIKIFSLVAKKCRQEDHLIPVLKKPKPIEEGDNKKKTKNMFDIHDDNECNRYVGELNLKNTRNEGFQEEIDDDEDNQFEGAIVFPPKKGVYFEPIPVLDYNSLYPSSIIQRNLSHECNIMDDDADKQYGYLPDWKYHVITYNTTYIFDELFKEARKDGYCIDFLRQIINVFVPSLKINYGELLVFNDGEIVDVASNSSKSSLSSDKIKDNKIKDNKNKNGNILLCHKDHDDEYMRITDPYLKENLKIVVKDSFKNISAIIKIVLTNLVWICKKYLNKNIQIVNNKEGQMFQIYGEFYRNKTLWVQIEYKKGHEKMIVFKTCKFAERSDGLKGIIPQTELALLNARKKCKDEMENEKDYFKRSILDGLQLAYKCTANSLYGQCGSPVSSIFMKDIAACTTATGREMLQYSRYYIEEIFGKLITLAIGDNEKKYMKYVLKTFDVFPFEVDTYGSTVKVHIEPNIKIPDKRFVDPKKRWNTKEEFFNVFRTKMMELLKGYSVDPKIIYGDTDSVFFNPKITSLETNEIQKDKHALEIAIQLGIWASETICKLLPDPQKQAYEKVLYPFAILTKKRYVGNLYETDPNKYYQKSMGIVMKRRDNAQIVKIVVGGIINEILNKKSARGAVEYAKKTLKQILMNKYTIDNFIVTKTLREKYADRTRIVHAVLADRMAKRDAGNKPMPNDRIPYAYVQVDREVELQGDRVEHPEYIIEKKLKLDYLFYITNQIMKPAIQFLELLINNPETIFDEYILREQNRRKGFKPVNFYLTNNKDNSDSDNDLNSDDDLDELQLKPKSHIRHKKKKIYTNDSNIDDDSDF